MSRSRDLILHVQTASFGSILSKVGGILKIMTLLVAGILGPLIHKNFLTNLANTIKKRIEKESRIFEMNENYASQ